MRKDNRTMKKTLKELIDKNKKPRRGSMCNVAYHPAMVRDIGQPRLGGDDVFRMLPDGN
jgi:hypothetical protein